jgi:serine/threonine protein kinase/tetratricopeptide (TPR) repeat protein
MGDDQETLDPTTQPPAGQASAAQRTIGPYRLLQLIGEGGFGAVYLAEQEQPVRRTVAIKLLKQDLDSREVVARFEQERQALALMDHPHIAKVLDAGTTGSGQPYFVMELVRGEPVTRYCDQNKLTIEQRLRLFVQICRAVQHAHQKGLIHRDIKPSNVLVTTQDDGPLAKVIDFGIAKATGGRLTAQAIHTQQFQLIGTPEYMSPEQAAGSLDIDTRTDVFSLGVLLYEMLTGSTPISREQLRSAGLLEIHRIIREVEPPKPSTRISQSATLLDVALQRRLDPKHLGLAIRGELDWIVMKAIEKGREQRYETANGLAMDVQRYLAGEPVLAAPPSGTYRLRKFVRRHTVAVTAGAAVALALVLGIAGTTAGLLRAERQRQLAVAAQQSEALARRKADAINEFIRTALVSADPNQGGRQEMKVVDAMAAAVQQLDSGAFAAEPDVEIGLRHTIGRILCDNGQPREALAVVEKSLALARRQHGADHSDVAMSLFLAGRAHKALGEPQLAEPLNREAVAMDRRLHPGGHLDTASALMGLAGALANQARHEEAEPLFREAMEMRRALIPGDHRDLAQSVNDYGYVLMSLGRAQQAEAFFQQSMEMRRRLFRGDSPDLAEALNNLAWSQERASRFPEAEANYRRSLEMYRRLFAGDHTLVDRGLANLGFDLTAQGRFAEAEPVLREAAEMAERLHPQGSERAVQCTSLRALCLLMLGRGAESEPLYRKAGESHARISDGNAVSIAAWHAASVLRAMRPVNPGGARAIATALYQRARRALPAGSLMLGEELTLYASALLAGDAPADAREAESVLREALSILSRTVPGTARLASGEAYLGAAILRGAELDRGLAPAARLARLREAEPLLVGGHERLETQKQGLPGAVRARRRGETAERLVALYRLWDALEPGTGKAAQASRYAPQAPKPAPAG